MLSVGGPHGTSVCSQVIRTQCISENPTEGITSGFLGNWKTVSYSPCFPFSLKSHDLSPLLLSAYLCSFPHQLPSKAPLWLLLACDIVVALSMVPMLCDSRDRIPRTIWLVEISISFLFLNMRGRISDARWPTDGLALSQMFLWSSELWQRCVKAPEPGSSVGATDIDFLIKQRRERANWATYMLHLGSAPPFNPDLCS